MLGLKGICLPLEGDSPQSGEMSRSDRGDRRRKRRRRRRPSDEVENPNQHKVYFTALNAPTPHQSLRDSFLRGEAKKTPRA